MRSASKRTGCGVVQAGSGALWCARVRTRARLRAGVRPAAPRRRAAMPRRRAAARAAPYFVQEDPAAAAAPAVLDCDVTHCLWDGVCGGAVRGWVLVASGHTQGRHRANRQSGRRSLPRAQPCRDSGGEALARHTPKKKSPTGTPATRPCEADAAIHAHTPSSSSASLLMANAVAPPHVRALRPPHGVVHLPAAGLNCGITSLRVQKAPWHSYEFCAGQMCYVRHCAQSMLKRPTDARRHQTFARDVRAPLCRTRCSPAAEPSYGTCRASSTRRGTSCERPGRGMPRRRGSPQIRGLRGRTAE